MVPSPYSEQAPEVKFLFTEPPLCGRLVLDFLFVKGSSQILRRIHRHKRVQINLSRLEQVSFMAGIQFHKLPYWVLYLLAQEQFFQGHIENECVEAST